MIERTCVVTVLSDDFVPGGLVLLKSLIKSNPWFTGDIVVLHNRVLSPLNGASRNHLTALAKQLKIQVLFTEIDLFPYRGLLRQAESRLKTPQRLMAAFLILEAFRFKQYDWILCLDSDMLVLKDIREILDTDGAFCAVPAHDSEGNKLGYFNSGVMLLRPSQLSESIFDNIMSQELVGASRGIGKADQAVLNRYFGQSGVSSLDRKFNVTKRELADAHGNLYALLEALDARIVHYVGEKPWNIKTSLRDHGYTFVEALWLHESLGESGDTEVAKIFETRRSQILSSVDSVSASEAPW